MSTADDTEINNDEPDDVGYSILIQGRCSVTKDAIEGVVTRGLEAAGFTNVASVGPANEPVCAPHADSALAYLYAKFPAQFATPITVASMAPDHRIDGSKTFESVASGILSSLEPEVVSAAVDGMNVVYQKGFREGHSVGFDNGKNTSEKELDALKAESKTVIEKSTRDSLALGFKLGVQALSDEMVGGVEDFVSSAAYQISEPDDGELVAYMNREPNAAELESLYPDMHNSSQQSH